MSPSRKMEYMRRAMLVRRYHQHTTIEVDTVGKHSAGVALFVMLMDPGCRKEVLEYCLLHDLSEFIVGDIPATAKRLLSSAARAEIAEAEDEAFRTHDIKVPKLDLVEKHLVKVADYLDGLNFCIEEAERGNRSMTAVGDKFISFIPEYLTGLDTLVPWLATAKELFFSLCKKWERLNGK